MSDAGDDLPGRLAWFEDLYRNAENDPGNVPWARLAPHPGLLHWAQLSDHRGGRAIDIGCGLGDNAEYLADLGYDTTAFDLSETAIGWAKQRFSESPVSYHAADLFDLPEDWSGRFNLASEIYTLQALPEDIRPKSLENIANLVAPGGVVVVVCIARDERDEVEGPPWPLAKPEIDRFLSHGFETLTFDDLPLGEKQTRHFVAVYRRR